MRREVGHVHGFSPNGRDHDSLSLGWAGADGMVLFISLLPVALKDRDIVGVPLVKD